MMNLIRQISRKALPMAAVAAAIAVGLAFLWFTGLFGEPATARAEALSENSDNQSCLMCHGKSGMTTKIGTDEVSVQVDGTAFEASVHGKQLSCLSCHPDKSGFPHNPAKADNARSYAVDSAKVCLKCHQSAYEDYRDSVHGVAATAGNNNAAACTDCHSSHDVQKAATLTYDPSACIKCHEKVVSSYRDSVHGKLVASGRTDAANCADCHTASGLSHKLQVVKASDSAASDVHVTETCGKCHTKVAENYASSYHGKAMRLGVSGAAPTCIDCHGTYGVQKVHGPEGPLDEAKVAQTCSKCHQGANENFAGGWIGHEEPSPSWFPVVFITERFLFYLTTTVVAFGILHVELDLLRWFVSGRKKRHGQEENEDEQQH